MVCALPPDQSFSNIMKTNVMCTCVLQLQFYLTRTILNTCTILTFLDTYILLVQLGVTKRSEFAHFLDMRVGL